MQVIMIIVCVCFAIFAYAVEKKFYNPVCIFCTVWALITFFTSLGLYGLYSVSGETYSILALGTFCFSIGGFVAFSQRRQFTLSFNRENYRPLAKDKVEFINYKFLHIFGLIILVYMVVQSIAVFTLFRSGQTLFDIRSALQGYSDSSYVEQITALRGGNESLWLRRIYDWIILPGFHSLVLITCIDMIVGNKDKLLLFLTLGNVLLKVYSEGTRVVIFHAVIYVLLLLFIFGKKSLLSRRTKRILRILIILGVLAIIIVSNVRLSTMKKSIGEEIYLYFCCCLPLLDKWVMALDASGTFTYGLASIYGLLVAPFRLLGHLGFPLEWLNNIQEILNNPETFVTIRSASYSTGANAYTTLYYQFYSDGGLLGCALGAFLFGYISGRIYVSFKKRILESRSYYRSLYLYLLMVNFIIMSFIRINFCRVDFAHMILFAFIMIKAENPILSDSKESNRQGTFRLR